MQALMMKRVRQLFSLWRANRSLSIGAILRVLFGITLGVTGSTLAIAQPATHSHKSTSEVADPSATMSPPENEGRTPVIGQGTLLVTLRSAVDSARSKNPALIESREKITQFKEQINFVRGAVFPNLSLTGSAGEHKDPANLPSAQFGGDPYNLYQADLHVAQPLFQVGLLSGIASADKDWQMRKLETEATRRDLTNQILAAYYLVTLDARNVDTLVRQQNVVKESLVAASRRERSGRDQLLDVLDTRTQIQLLEPQISVAKDQLESAVASLANLMGNIDERTIHIKSELNVPDLAVADRLVDLRQARFPELEKDRVGVEQVEDQRRVALGQNLPNLAFTADYIYQDNKKSDLFDEDAKSFQAGVLLTVPIFSGLSSIYQQRALASQRTQLEIDQQNLRNNFNLQQVTARKKLESADFQIKSGIEALRLAQAASNEARRNYRLATIDFLRFLSVQQAFVQAEQNLNQNKYAYIVALGNYFVASGQELDGLVDLLERSSIQ